MSKVIDVVNAPWAITQTMLGTITDIYMSHLRGERGDIAALEASYGKTFDNKQENYQVINGVAALPVHGVMAKRMNMFQAISGGVSHEIVAADFRDAMANSKVKAIVLDVDSPGGTVDGTAELADIIYQARGEKPIIAVANGLMASAGYWVGSAADEVVLASPTTNIGGIGVVTQHVEYSKQDQANGITRTDIYAGEFKRLVSDAKALSTEGKDYIQAQVDYLYAVFLSTVAKHHGIDAEQVHTQMADGRIFIGEQGIEAGLATRIATLEQVIEDLATTGTTRVAITPRASAAHSPKETPTMDISKESIETDHPDLAAAFRAEGATAESQRIQAVAAQALPGHEALIESVKYDGKTTGAEAAVLVLAAEKTARQQAVADITADAPVVPVAATGSEEDEPEAPTPMDPAAIGARAKQIVAEQAKLGHTISASQAVKLAQEEAK
jgi:signal peptide peptidase SppA